MPHSFIHGCAFMIFPQNKNQDGNFILINTIYQFLIIAVDRHHELLRRIMGKVQSKILVRNIVRKMTQVMRYK